MKKKYRHLFWVVCLILLSGFFGWADQDKQYKQTWDGSMTVPVHRIPLKDQFDQTIIPTEFYPLPYSDRFTCAPCHDYDRIQSGLHFNSLKSPMSGRTGEPWIWLDEKTGTVLPLSYRDWPGMWNPKEIGLSFWEFTRMFGRHMTGGGVNEPHDDEITPESRWEVSGKLEINCLGCHNVSKQQSHSEWAKQILRENFRWAAVAASGLGEVGGMASRLAPTWDIMDGPNLDDTEYAVVPEVRYYPGDFDSKHRVFFDVARNAGDERCLACHSVTPVSTKKLDIDKDVHSRAGVICADCHRHDIQHQMVRGYESEAEDYENSQAFDFSCQGCHIGKDLSKRSGTTIGRLGAPYPKHNGIPVVHFEKLNCTVCHSGPYPGKEPVRIRTSRANRLGIYGIAHWQTDFPHIVEPVFAKDESGKLAPHRLMWPSFWGWRDGEELKLLKPSEVESAAGDILDAEKSAAQVLAALSGSPDIAGEPVFILQKKIYSLNLDGGLDTADYSSVDSLSDIWWGLRNEKQEGIIRLIPEFDPDSDEQAPDMEILIQMVLEAMAGVENKPGIPVVINGKYLYRIQEGYLERLDWQRDDLKMPQLCWLSGEETLPLVSESHLKIIKAIVGAEQTLTEEQVTMVLRILADKLGEPEKDSREYFYISAGKMFMLDDSGELSVEDHSSAKPILWPLGHQVRPSQQSLGINGCGDCHKALSSFFFNTVKATGLLLTDRGEKRSGVYFMGLDEPYQRLFGLSFTVRPVLKFLIFISACMIGIILLIVLGLKIGQISGLIEKRR